MRLTNEQVEHIALLARLELPESDVDRGVVADQLSAILDHFEQLNALDTDGVERTDHVVPVVNVLRADVPRPSLPREAALQNAPESADGMFQVPRVVEAE